MYAFEPFGIGPAFSRAGLKETYLLVLIYLGSNLEPIASEEDAVSTRPVMHRRLTCTTCLLAIQFSRTKTFRTETRQGLMRGCNPFWNNFD